MIVKLSTVASALVLAASLSAGCREQSAPSSDQGDPSLTMTGTGGAGMCNSSVTPDGIGGSSGIAFPGRQPVFTGPTVTLPNAPPAISGGTLRVLSDGATAVAADPDRDRVYVVDLPSRTVKSTVTLQPGDEPGRLVEDGAGRVQVALRHGGALVTIAPATGEIVARRDACAAPRGVAYDAAADVVHVACAGGELVTFPAGDGPAVRTLRLDHDLRDVMVAGDGRLRVTRFRSAEVLTVEADGTVSGRVAPPPFRSQATRGGQLFSPAVAWKAMASPVTGDTVMLHQRGVDDPIQPAVGGYGGRDTCNTIVQTAVTTMSADGTVKSGPALVGLVVAVDMAVSPDGNRVAIVAPGNAHTSFAPGQPPSMPIVSVIDMTSATDQVSGCRPDLTMGAVDPFVIGMTGEPIAVAFTPAGDIVVQSREPAMLELQTGEHIQLATDSRADTGHMLFHANSGGSIACASCHAEGNEDGRVWKFSTSCEGATPRRTQSLQTGLRGTEPFHWSGEERDFPALVKDVFVGRMSGPTLADDQVDATLKWIDAQPRPALSPPADPAAVDRGRALFADTARAGCASCHNGDRLTNNQTIDVGTGGTFQVPSLVGIGSRGPYLHDGCAKTLRDRFGACGGGDKHGVTSTLSDGELSDLVTYLTTL